MRKVLLDGKKMKKKEDVHPYLKEKLKVPGYDGNNLDALWDVLSTYDKPLAIELINEKNIRENLVDYGKALIQLFEDATEENPNIKFRVGQSRTEPF